MHRPRRVEQLAQYLRCLQVMSALAPRFRADRGAEVNGSMPGSSRSLKIVAASLSS